MIKGLENKYNDKKEIILRGFKVYWRRNNSNIENEEENMSFIISYNGMEAINKFLASKGGFERVVIYKVQEYNMETKEDIDEPLYANDKKGILYQMITDYNDNKKENE
ncbi:hypothetical protein [uncultured Clostridium sp.]|uniref:hypothetical protein n=1 Tax=uncultured Clostridium sp. TaxID=59620 RepID=UPI00263AF06C|nr:hypothetical protein [uncultured Clostridium sp.]